MMLRKFLPALVVAAAAVLPLAASASDIYEDVGVIIGMRGYATVAMNYCHENVAKETGFTEARDAWLVRNSEELSVVDAAIVKLGGISADDQKTIDTTIADKVKSDVTAQTDQAGFCHTLADALKSGSRDLKTLADSNDAMGRIRDLLKTP